MTTLRPDPDEVLQHVRRTDLPWRQATHTNCGREIAELAPDRVISHSEARAKVNRMGKQRAAMFLCMTCAGRWYVTPEWDDDPVGRMYAECQKFVNRSDSENIVAHELRAIAMLIAAHRDEFNEAVAGLSGAVSLTAARATKRQRAGRR